MSKKKHVQVELDGKEVDVTNTDSEVTTETVAETTAETATPADAAPKKTRVRKAPRSLFIAKVESAKKFCTDLASAKYRNVGEEFCKLIDGALAATNDAAIIANMLPDDWKPGKGTHNGKKAEKFANGDFVRAKEKFFASFTEMGIGNGPFKVLGMLPVAKQVKLVLDDGTCTYIPQNLVERVPAVAE